MKKIKVLHLVNGHRMLGAERVAAEIVRAIDKQSIGSSIGLVNGGVSLQREFQDHIGDAGDVHILAGTNALQTARAVARHCRRYHFDIIHSHGYKSDFLSLFSRLMQQQIQLVATNHNYITDTFRGRLYRRLDLRILRCFDRVVAVSGNVREDMIAGGFPEDRIQIVENGIDTDFCTDEQTIAQVRAEVGAGEKSILLGIVASLTPGKGHADLLDAVRSLACRFPEIRLLIIGDGPLKPTLAHICAESGISRHVAFLGHRSDVRRILPALDIFILPSYKEGLPMSILEAMAAGAAVIATTVGAVPSVISNNQTGLLFLPGEIRQMEKKIRLLIKNSRLRRRIADAAKIFVKTHYGASKMASAYAKVYRELAASP